MTLIHNISIIAFQFLYDKFYYLFVTNTIFI